jgi:hypothetical protein
MITYTITLTKKETDPWITLNTIDDNFTQNEKDTIITPFLQFESTLEGLHSGYPTYVTEGDTHTITYVFDTIENLTSSRNAHLDNDICKVKNELFSNALKAKGITYTSVAETIFE